MFTAENVVITGGNFNTHLSAIQSNPLDFIFRSFGNHYVASATHDNNDVLDAPKCHPGTRTSFLRRLSTWVPDTETSIYMIWLNGPAGAGKSAIARSLADILKADCLLAASFFFFRTDSNRNTEKPLVTTLAYQIACNIPQVQPYIAKAITTDPSICSRSLQTQFKTLILKPLKQMMAPESNSLLQPALIIVDGLDECIDKNARNLILEVVFDALPLLHGRIKFLIISRPEYDIQRSFNSTAAIEYIDIIELLGNLQAYEDIRKYLHDNFNRIKRNHPLRRHFCTDWPSAHAIEQLVEKSSGYFIYVSTVIKYIENDFDHPQKRLDIVINLLTTSQNPYAALDALYLNILTSSRTNRVLLTNILAFALLDLQVDYIVYLDEETMQTVRFMETVLFLQPGGVQVALLDLKSLVKAPVEGKGIDVWHKSFLDFLLDPSRSNEFHVSSAHACTVIAKGCLRLLSDKTGLLQRSWSWLIFGLGDPMVDCHYLLSVCCGKAILDPDLQTDMLNYEFSITPALDNVEARTRAFWVLCSSLVNYQKASIFQGTKIVEHIYHQFDCYFLSELRCSIALDSAAMAALRSTVSPVCIDWKTSQKLPSEELFQFFNYKFSFLQYLMDNEKFRASEDILCRFFYSKDRAGEYYLGELATELSTSSKTRADNTTVSNIGLKSKREGQDQAGRRNRRRIEQSISLDEDDIISKSTAAYTMTSKERQTFNRMIPATKRKKKGCY